MTQLHQAAPRQASTGFHGLKNWRLARGPSVDGRNPAAVILGRPSWGPKKIGPKHMALLGVSEDVRTFFNSCSGKTENFREKTPS